MPGHIVEVDQVGQAVGADHAVQAGQEEVGRLRGADEHVEGVAGGVVQEEQGDPTEAVRSGAEVLAVAQQALHPVRVAPAATVQLLAARPVAGRQPHPDAGPPGRGPVHRQLLVDHLADPGATDQLGDRGSGVADLLLLHEGDERLGQGDRGRGAPPPLRLQGSEVAVRALVGGQPALDGADGDAPEATVGSGVVPSGDGAHSSAPWPPREHQGGHLGEHGVPGERRLGGGTGDWADLDHDGDDDDPAPGSGAPCEFVGGGARLGGETDVERSGVVERRASTQRRGGSHRRGRAHRRAS